MPQIHNTGLCNSPISLFLIVLTIMVNPQLTAARMLSRSATRVASRQNLLDTDSLAPAVSPNRTPTRPLRGMESPSPEVSLLGINHLRRAVQEADEYRNSIANYTSTDSDNGGSDDDVPTDNTFLGPIFRSCVQSSS